MPTIQQRDVTRRKPRRCPRVRISSPFSCSLSSLSTRWWFRKPVKDVGLVYDLSPHGLCVSTEAEIKPGEEVSLSLRLTKGTPPAEIAVATVCWTNHHFYGLVFRRMSESSVRQVMEYVNATGMEEE